MTESNMDHALSAAAAPLQSAAFHRISRHNRTQSREAGMSLIELMIAGLVLIVGFMAIMVLVTGAIAGNTRNRSDSTATTLAQMVMENISVLGANSTSTLILTDCAGNSWTVAAAGSSSGTGASLSSNAVNFSASTVTNYSMNYVVCSSNGTRSTYDIRWNVKTLTTDTALVTVAARPKGATTDLRRFAIPISLRAIVGQ